MNKKKVLAAVLAVVSIAALLFGAYRLGQQEQHPKIVEIPSVTTQNVQAALPKESAATVQDATHQMQRAKETQAPQYHYYTVTQQQADAKAQEYAQKQKADKVIKDTNERQILDENGEPTGQSVIENDYYAINLERKHKIKAGAAVIDKTAYVSVGYQNRDVEYDIYWAPEKKDIGIGIQVTIAKW